MDERVKVYALLKEYADGFFDMTESEREGWHLRPGLAARIQQYADERVTAARAQDAERIREECARVLETMTPPDEWVDGPGWETVLEYAARKIRALTPQAQPSEREEARPNG